MRGGDAAVSGGGGGAGAAYVRAANLYIIVNKYEANCVLVWGSKSVSVLFLRVSAKKIVFLHFNS